jgi:hypothetical protein
MNGCISESPSQEAYIVSAADGTSERACYLSFSILDDQHRR